MLYIRHIPGKGRGVFTDCPIAKGEIVEVCPIIRIPKQDMAHLASTVIYEYSYDWDEERGGEECLPCGYGALYNHSADSNIEWDTDREHETIVFTAERDIAADEELCHDYWFDQEVTFDEQGRWRSRLEALET